MKTEFIQPAATLAAALLHGKPASFPDIVSAFELAYQALEQAERTFEQRQKPAPAGPTSAAHGAR